MALKRVLNLPTVVSTSAGLTFATSCFVAAVQVASYVAGDSAWLAILVAGFLSLLAGLSFSELNGVLPSASGVRLYFTKAYNDFFSLSVSIFYIVALTTVVGTEGYVFSQVIKKIFPALPSFLWVTAMILTVVLLNIRGIKLAGRFQDIVTYGLITSLLVLAFVAMGKTGFTLVHPASVGSLNGLVNAVAIGVFLFIGFEWVTPLAEEVTQIKLISRGMLIAIGILSITYGLFTVAMTSTVPKSQLIGSPIPHILFAQKMLGSTGVILMVMVSLAASITTFNAGLLSASRFLYATAREHALPSLFSRLSNKYFTPWVSIITIGLICLTSAAVIFATGHYLTLVNVGAGIESLVYALAGFAVFRLRKKMPDAERPFKLWGGPLVPLATVIVFAFLTVAVLSQDVWAGLYIVAGLLVSATYVRFAVPVLRQKAEAARAEKKATSRRPRPVQTAAPANSTPASAVPANQSSASPAPANGNGSLKPSAVPEKIED